MNTVQVLKRCEVFVGLSDSDLEIVSGLSSWRKETYNAGEIIFKEENKARDFYILEKGEVRLVVTLRKGESKELTQVPMVNITKGDIFGWSSIVYPHSLTMSAICIKPSSIVSVCGAELKALMNDNPSIGYEIMRGLVRVIGARLRDLRHRFIDKDKLFLPKEEISI